MNKITCICLGVRSMQRALKFYRDGLGYETDCKDDNPPVCFFNTPGTKFELYPLGALARDIDENYPPSFGADITRILPIRTDTTGRWFGDLILNLTRTDCSNFRAIQYQSAFRLQRPGTAEPMRKRFYDLRQNTCVLKVFHRPKRGKTKANARKKRRHQQLFCR